MSAKTANFTTVELGAFAEVEYGDNDRPKKFLKDTLALTGMEISVTTIPAGGKSPFFHSHKQNEELYIFIQGSGQMQLDDNLVDVKEGTLIKVLPASKRAIRASADAQLVYLCIQAKENSLEQYTKGDGIINNDVDWINN